LVARLRFVDDDAARVGEALVHADRGYEQRHREHHRAEHVQSTQRLYSVRDHQVEDDRDRQRQSVQMDLSRRV
jgi:hypothetical protein